MAGPRLASIDSTQGALLNALLGNLTGSTVNVNVLDWQTLTSGNVDVARMIDALQVSLGASTPSQALTTNVSLLQLINAAAASTLAPNAASVTASLNNIAVPLSVPAGNIRLGDLLSLAGAPGHTSINALDLITGAVQLYNYRNVATTTTPVAVSVAGLTGVNNVTLAAQVVEPPVYVCAAQGASFHTAAIRVKLNLTLPASAPLTGVLNSILNVTNSSVTLGTAITLYVEVARADGTMDVVNALTNALHVQATPGVADLYLGSIADATFFNRTRSLAYADFGYANFGTLSLTALGLVSVTGTIQIRSHGRGQAPSASGLGFLPPYPQTGTVYSSSASAANLLTDLLANLDVHVTLNLLPILNLDLTVAGLLKPIISNALSPVLSSVLTVTVDPLLQLLGIRIGEAVITAYGTYSICTVSGVAYSDVNHNAMLDRDESGTSLTLYAKLVPSTSPTRAAQVATINTSTGAFSFSGVASDSYSVLIDTNNTVTDVTATAPSAWFPTEAPTMVRSFTLSTRDVPSQNFGLFNGSRLSGRIFLDNGVGSGSIANNVVKETNESGLTGVAVRVTDAAGTTSYDTTTSGDAGVYTLWIPASAGAVAMKIVEANAATYVSTGANVGNTGGTYDRATDAIAFTHVVGTAYANVNFADVLAAQFDTDGRQSVLPGNVAFYPHSFTAGTSGQVTFAGTAPSTPGWSYSIFSDANCNGSIDGADAALSGALATIAAQKVCVVVRVFAAETAAYNAQYPLSVSATFAYSNSALSDVLSRSDLTVVGDAGEAGLRLTKTVDRATATPGQVLQYTITFTNRSSGPLTSIRIQDVTPAYTVYASAGCGALAPGITACAATTQPGVGAAGSIEWTLTGALLPGGTGTVQFQVTLQ